MLVRFPQPLVISEYFNYDRFGEIVLALPLDGRAAPVHAARRSTSRARRRNARTLANSLRRITLDDAQSAQNPPVLRHPNGDPFSLTNRFRGGDTVQNTVGVLGFDFSLYRIFPTGPADYTAVNPRPAAPEPVGGSAARRGDEHAQLLRDARLPDRDNPLGQHVRRQRRTSTAAAPTPTSRSSSPASATSCWRRSPGSTPTSSASTSSRTRPASSRSATREGIVAGLNAILGADLRLHRHRHDRHRRDQGRPDLPPGRGHAGRRLPDPRLDRSTRASSTRRAGPSLAQTFEENATGARFTVVVNHLKSKGSDCNDVGDPDLGDGQGNCNGHADAAAEALVDWLATDPTGSGDPDFLIMGDLNSYAQEDPIDAIKAGLGRHGRHRRRLHQPDRRVPGPVRLLVHVRRPGRLPRPRARQRRRSPAR